MAESEEGNGLEKTKWVLEALDSGDFEKEKAATSLIINWMRAGHFKEERFAAAGMPDDYVQQIRSALLRCLDKRAYEIINGKVENIFDDAVRRIWDGLPDVSLEEIQPFIRMAEKGTVKERLFALNVLGAVVEMDSIKCIIGNVRHSDKGVSLLATSTLDGKLDGYPHPHILSKECAKMLLDIACDPHLEQEQRAHALRLGMNGAEKQMLPELINFLDSEEMFLVDAATEEIATLGEVGIRAVAKSARNGEFSDKLRITALEKLEELVEKAFNVEIEIDEEDEMLFGFVGKKILPLVKDKNEKIRLAALKFISAEAALLGISDDRFKKLVLPLLKHENREVRCLAFDILLDNEVEADFGKFALRGNIVDYVRDAIGRSKPEKVQEHAFGLFKTAKLTELIPEFVEKIDEIGSRSEIMEALANFPEEAIRCACDARARGKLGADSFDRLIQKMGMVASDETGQVSEAGKPHDMAGLKADARSMLRSAPMADDVRPVVRSLLVRS